MTKDLKRDAGNEDGDEDEEGDEEEDANGEKRVTTFFSKSKAISKCKFTTPPTGPGWETYLVKELLPFYEGPTNEIGRGKKTVSGMFIKDTMQSKARILAFFLSKKGQNCDPKIILPKYLTAEELQLWKWEDEPAPNNEARDAAIALAEQTVAKAAVIPPLPVIPPASPAASPAANPAASPAMMTASSDVSERAAKAVSRARAAAQAAAKGVGSSSSSATSLVATAAAPVAAAAVPSPIQLICQFGCSKEVAPQTAYLWGAISGHQICASHQFAEHIYSGFTKWPHWRSLYDLSGPKKGGGGEYEHLLQSHDGIFQQCLQFLKTFSKLLITRPYLTHLPGTGEWRLWSMTCSNCFMVKQFQFHNPKNPKLSRKFGGAGKCEGCQAFIWLCCGKKFTDTELAEAKKNGQQTPFPHCTSYIFEPINEEKLFARQVLYSVFRYCPVCFACFEPNLTGIRECKHCNHSVCMSCFKEVLLPQEQWSWAKVHQNESKQQSFALVSTFRLGWSLLCQSVGLAAPLYYKDALGGVFPFDYDNRARSDVFHQCSRPSSDDDCVRPEWLKCQTVFGRDKAVYLRDQFCKTDFFKEYVSLVRRVCV